MTKRMQQLIIALLAFLLMGMSPVQAVLAARTAERHENGVVSAETQPTAPQQQTEEENESAGAFFILALLALIIVIIALVAIVGAVGLGVIGIGYWTVSGDDD